MKIELRSRDSEFVISIEAEDKTANEEGGYLPGDIYIAKRNTGWHLLRCKDYNEKEGYVSAKITKSGQVPYAYNSTECHRVISMKTGTGFDGPVVEFDLE